jgi:protein-tyrosine phosphatase
MPAPPAAPDASYALLVLDDDGSELRRFRSTTALPPMDGLSTTGLASLRCSGSAQPSVPAFRDLRQRLGDVPAEDLYIADLRQESHGFVNEAAVSWYALSNWGSAGLSDDEALAIETLRLRLLALGQSVRIGRVETIKRGAPPCFVEWERPRVAGEEQAFGLLPGHYVRLPVTDHSRPSDAVVDRFIHLVRSLRGSSHLHLHCRGGKGRTATFMALYDMLRNAAHVPLSALLARQARLGDYDLTKRPDPASAKAPFIADRLAFIERFHEYARHNPDGAPLPWTAWLAERSREMVPARPK